MAGLLDEEQIRRVREATDLVALVGDYVPVQRAGANMRACCPFHDERSPSFYIYTDDMHYHCFGCGAHGDAVTFVREKEGLDFLEAMEVLARRVGIELVFEEGRAGGRGLQRSDRDRYTDLMQRACTLYENVLWEQEEGAEARLYLQERGLAVETCRNFRLGWAPSGDLLLRGARKQGVALADLQRLDLVTERNGRLGDRFRGRLLFPICDRFGSVIAFSGRLLPAAQAEAKARGIHIGKYINSTDTPLYRKGLVVYNLHRARGASRREGRLVVMEGPTDVMAAAQAGLHGCVAVLGTAMTDEHARQLGRAIGPKGRLVLLFDGDAAGQATSCKAVTTCLAIGLPTQVAVMPSGQDPADLLRGCTDASRLEKLLGDSRADIAHLLRSLAPRPYALDEKERWRVIDELLAAARPIVDVDLRDGYIDEIAHYMNADVPRLRKRLRAATAPQDWAPTASPGPALPALAAAQDLVLHLLIRHPELRAEAFDRHQIEPAAFPPPYAQLLHRMLAEPDEDFAALIASPVVSAQPALSAELYRYRRQDRSRAGVILEEPATLLTEQVATLKHELLAQDLARLEHELREAQAGGDLQRAGTLFGEVMQLQRQMRDLSG